jgi:hypothetical protein
MAMRNQGETPTGINKIARTIKVGIGTVKRIIDEHEKRVA